MHQSTSTEHPEYLLEADDSTVWFQANALFGNMVPGLSNEDWAANRERALRFLEKYTAARTLIRMKPGEVDFVDLDTTPLLEDPYFTEALITTNPNHILHSNAADCGEVAIHGFGAEVSAEVIALIHVSRHSFSRGSHLKALLHMRDVQGVKPDGMYARVAPSARAESYVFPGIDPAQKVSSVWKKYVSQDANGMWHVDFHRRTLDDLSRFGIPEQNITVSEVDTAAPDAPYFSRMKYNKGTQPVRSGNGLMYALRG